MLLQTTVSLLRCSSREAGAAQKVILILDIYIDIHLSPTTFTDRLLHQTAVMLRRSTRLDSQGYYDNEGLPIICYKEHLNR
ncbi:hypothetical protein KUCAC02_014207 [Chaenocephalus aceratus]|uniref:Uncharacterized protein n=1 Tax=Chaenocephalus aceratus TaxID=36190 RepID=A0ACB9WEW9_CHAAC|nr:hypothetical protein KUCAC02_014207 [Chaenocephalus aceratus]